MATNTKPATGAAPAKKDNKTPRERFTSVGAKRVSKALKALRNLQPVANKKSYEFSAADVDKLSGALRSELNAVETAFKNALEGKSAAKAESGFSF
jgi:hypothetical protein